MQEEIKEILDRLFVYKNENDEMKYQPEDILTIDDVWLLLDYITNLQEYETTIEMEFKREYAKRYLEERRKEEPHLLYPDSDEIYKRYYELKEKNERLNNIIDELEKDINNQLTMTRKFDKYNEGFFNATLHYYNKLNELKGDNK